MNPHDLKKILDDLHHQKLTPKQAMKKLATLPYENLGFAKVDHHRSLRIGMPGKNDISNKKNYSKHESGRTFRSGDKIIQRQLP